GQQENKGRHDQGQHEYRGRQDQSVKHRGRQDRGYDSRRQDFRGQDQRFNGRNGNDRQGQGNYNQRQHRGQSTRDFNQGHASGSANQRRSTETLPPPPLCTTCGKPHPGVCYKATGGCFTCGSTQHKVKGRGVTESVNVRPKLVTNCFKRVTEEEASMLEEKCTEGEVWMAVKNCGSSKSPGPDDFNLKFIKRVKPKNLNKFKITKILLMQENFIKA
ncbi:hypothetical protein Tco_1580332, partial [Tanacetum coccineum]